MRSMVIRIRITSGESKPEKSISPMVSTYSAMMAWAAGTASPVADAISPSSPSMVCAAVWNRWM
jgi:hypothetical protein